MICPENIFNSLTVSAMSKMRQKTSPKLINAQANKFTGPPESNFSFRPKETLLGGLEME
ncbi:MAG: hypothetical protein AB7E04_02680 [Desulfobacteraceae bacterium]